MAVKLNWWSDEELLLHPDDAGVAIELHSRGLQPPDLELETQLHATNEECDGLNNELDDVYLEHQDEINETVVKVRGLYNRIDIFLGGDGVSDTEKQQKEKIKTVAEMMSAK